MLKTHPIDVYDYIYSWKDYAAEAQTLKEICKEMGVPPNGQILEVACGTGRYLEHFSGMKQFGVDLCERSLQYANMRIADGVFFCQDMCDLQIPKKMDVILCIFGAIGYLSPEEETQRAFAGFYQQLKPGGILILEPWVSAADFQVGEAFIQSYQSPNFKVARMVVAKQKNRRCVLNFSFVLCRAGWRVERFESQEKLWLHDHGVIIKDLQNIGFSVGKIRSGFLEKSPLYVAMRPSS